MLFLQQIRRFYLASAIDLLRNCWNKLLALHSLAYIKRPDQNSIQDEHPFNPRLASSNFIISHSIMSKTAKLLIKLCSHKLGDDTRRDMSRETCRLTIFVEQELYYFDKATPKIHL